MLKRTIASAWLCIFCHATTDTVASADPVLDEPQKSVESAAARLVTLDAQIHESLRALQTMENEKIPAQIAATSRLLEEMIILASRPSTFVNARTKQALERGGEHALFLTRALFKRLSRSNEERGAPVLSAAVVLENQLLHYLNIVKDKETWSAEVRVGLGAGLYRDNLWKPRTQLALGFQFDLGNSIDGAATFGLMTDKREAKNTIVLPPKTVDTFGVSEIWFRLKRARSLQFQIGRMAEPAIFYWPSEWPFFSLQGTLFVASGGPLESHFRFRHDRFGYFLSEANDPKARLVERNVSEFVLAPTFEAVPLTLSSRFTSRFHWYADPTDAVRQLSFGRERKLEEAPLREGGRYRILELSIDNTVDLVNGTHGGVALFEMRNLAFQRSAAARGAEVRFSKAWQNRVTTTMNAFSVRIECAVAPPLQFSPLMLPGFQSRGVGASGQVRLGTRVQFIPGFYVVDSLPISSGAECGLQKSGKILPRFIAGATIHYEFQND